VNRSRQVLITDYGPHPPDLWALATADHLVHLDLNRATVKELQAAQRLENAVAEALLKHVKRLQEDERNDLIEKGDDAVRLSHDPGPYIDQAFKDIKDAAIALKFPEDREAENIARRFERHFSDGQVEATAKQVLREHFTSLMHIEHSWFAGKTDAHARHRKEHGMAEPGEKARTFRALHHPEG
jgi:hypothetical protein